MKLRGKLSRISDEQHVEIMQLGSTGMSVADISKRVKVSRLTVYEHLDPSKKEARARRTRAYMRTRYIGTGTNKSNAVVISGLHKRQYTGRCEMCGKLQEKKLHYHHWDDNEPSLGIWVCMLCHRAIRYIESAEELKKLTDLYIVAVANAVKEFYPNDLKDKQVSLLG